MSNSELQYSFSFMLFLFHCLVTNQYCPLLATVVPYTRQFFPSHHPYQQLQTLWNRRTLLYYLPVRRSGHHLPSMDSLLDCFPQSVSHQAFLPAFLLLSSHTACRSVYSQYPRPQPRFASQTLLHPSFQDNHISGFIITDSLVIHNLLTTVQYRIHRVSLHC